jgi:streptogramin lyase
MPLTGHWARVVTALIGAVAALGGCAGPAPPATPPPPEPYTDLAPVEVKVDSDPDWLAAGFGSVWLKRPEGFVDRIDAATATVTVQIAVHETRPEACEGIGSDADSIWSCDRQDLVRIDPATNKVVTTVPAGKISGQGRIVTAAGRMWVLAGEGDRLVGVAEADGSLSDPITLPAACHDLGASGDIIYVVCERAGRVLRVDPSSATVTADVEMTSPVWVSAAGSGVWVSAEQDLLRLDPATLATAVRVEGLGTGNLGAIWADDGGVWVRKVNPFITRVHATGSITHVISAPYQSGGDVLAEGEHLWVTSFDDRLLIRLDDPT